MPPIDDPVPRAAGQALITGVYRSGSEFLAQLLALHPAISVTMYHVNAARFLRGRYDPLSDRANLVRAVDDTASRLGERYRLALDREAVLAACAARQITSWGRLYDVIMSALWLGHGHNRWAEKCQLVWRELPEFLAELPQARAILLVRDPRSVLASFKRYTYAMPPAYLGAAFNCLDSMVSGRALATSEPGRVRLVRYEDAVRAPERTAHDLLDFLGVDPAAASFDSARWRDAFGRRWRKNTVFESEEGPFDTERAIHRWREHLEDWEVGWVETVCGSEMDAFGYERRGVQADWPAILQAILPDSAMTAHLRRWVTSGEGMQAFPTDPLEKANWEENALSGPRGAPSTRLAEG